MASKDIKALITHLEQHGWTCRQRRRGGHWRVTGPNGELAFLSLSPSDHRSLKNVRATLRKLGAPLPTSR